MDTSCPLKDVLGEPDVGLRAIKIANIAILDVALAVLITWLLQRGTKLNYISLFILILTVTFIMRWAFCIQTIPYQIGNTLYKSLQKDSRPGTI